MKNFALIRADAICEKPLVLNPWNIDALSEIEWEARRKGNAILQLRLHPAIVGLKEEISNRPRHSNADIELTYITFRGRWYLISWNGDVYKSSGLLINLGIHFFDMQQWVFGKTF